MRLTTMKPNNDLDLDVEKGYAYSYQNNDLGSYEEQQDEKLTLNPIAHASIQATNDIDLEQQRLCDARSIANYRTIARDHWDYCRNNVRVAYLWEERDDGLSVLQFIGCTLFIVALYEWARVTYPGVLWDASPATP